MTLETILAPPLSLGLPAVLGGGYYMVRGDTPLKKGFGAAGVLMSAPYFVGQSIPSLQAVGGFMYALTDGLYNLANVTTATLLNSAPYAAPYAIQLAVAAAAITAGVYAVRGVYNGFSGLRTALGSMFHRAQAPAAAPAAGDAHAAPAHPPAAPAHPAAPAGGHGAAPAPHH